MCMVQRHLGQEDVHRKRADLVGAKEEHIDAARTAARAADMRKHVAREKQLNKRQTQAREKRTQFEGAFGETKQQLKSKEQAVRDSRPVLRWKDHTCSIIKPDPELRRRKREAERVGRLENPKGRGAQASQRADAGRECDTSGKRPRLRSAAIAYRHSGGVKKLQGVDIASS